MTSWNSLHLECLMLPNIALDCQACREDVCLEK